MKRKLYIDDYDWEDLPIENHFNVAKNLKRELQKEKRRRRPSRKKRREDNEINENKTNNTHEQ